MAPVIVYGSSHLGVRVAALLAEGGHEVTAVGLGPGLRALLPPGIEVVDRDPEDDRTLASLLALPARALVLPSEDEHLNVRAALLAAERAPGLRVVARLHDLRLGRTLEATLPSLRVLSVSELAAPAFAAAAVLEGPLLAVGSGRSSRSIFRACAGVLGGGTVAEIEARHGVVVVASGDELLPPAERLVAGGPATVLCGPMEAARRLGAAPSPAGGRAAPPGPRRTIRERLRQDAILRRTLAAIALVICGATGWFSIAERLTPLTALYFVVTTLTTTGYGDISLANSGAASRVAGMLLMLSGLTLSAMLFAMVTDGLLRRRQDLLAGRAPTGAEDHVVLCGAGDVGLRVLRELEALGERVVVIERDGEHAHLEAVRERRVPLVVADATREETLRNAGLLACRALVCATDDDLTNLRIALVARALVPDLHVVLRIFDRAFAARLERSLGIHVALSSSEIAAPAFVSAAVGADVVGAVELGGRHVQVGSGAAAGARRSIPGGGWIGVAEPRAPNG